MKNVLLLGLTLFLFFGCSHKNDIQTLQSEKISIKNHGQPFWINIENKTDASIYIKYDIEQALAKKGVVLSDKDKSRTQLDLNIVYANQIDKKSSLGDIMKAININIGIGGSSGNVSLYTSIGATLGRLLGENLDSSFYQVVVDVTVYENETKKNTQWIITAPLDGKEEQAIIYAIEEEIVQRTIALFE